MWLRLRVEAWVNYEISYMSRNTCIKNIQQLATHTDRFQISYQATAAPHNSKDRQLGHTTAKIARSEINDATIQIVASKSIRVTAADA